MRGPKAESNAQAQAGTMQTQESMWAGDKMAAGDRKAAKEAVWVTNSVCIPQGKKVALQQGDRGQSGVLGCGIPPGCVARHGLAAPQQGGEDTPAPAGLWLQSTPPCAAMRI